MTAVLSRLRRVVYTRVGGGAGRRSVLVYVRTGITLIIATISENEQQEGVQFALRHSSFAKWTRHFCQISPC